MKEKENNLLQKNDNSEKYFQYEITKLKERRLQQERRLKSLSKVVPKDYHNYLKREKTKAAIKIQKFWRNKHKMDIDLTASNYQQRRSQAVITIQLAVRRWLSKKRKSEVWSRSLLKPHLLTEERVKALQEEIDSYQQNTHVRFPNFIKRHYTTLNLSQPFYCNIFFKIPHGTDLAQLNQTAQWRYAKFQQTLPRNRIKEHRDGVMLAQTKTITETLIQAPKLGDYDESQWKTYHSLSMAIATKARVEHKRKLLELNLPSWKKLLNELESS